MSSIPNSNTSMMVPPSEYSENRIPNTTQFQYRQSRDTSQGPVAILWDIENCPVPSDVRSEDVAGNIRMALRVHPILNGAVTMFAAYGDFNSFPRRLREGCQRTGVKLIDVPNGRKDAADKAILVDMFLFALDNPPPSSIMLISGDVDFSPALHILGQRGYTVILVIPSSVGVSSALCNSGRFVWDWPSIARGEGFVPPSKPLLIPPHQSGSDEISGLLTGCQINIVMDGQNEEESIVYKGVSRNYCNTNNGSSTVRPPPNPTNLRSQSFSTGLKEVLSKPGEKDLIWVQPGDLNGLKGQLVKLLELSGGILPLTRLPAEYQKMYGRPLYVSEYGALKLVNLLQKMTDAIAVEGKAQRRFIYLRASKPGQVGSPIILARRDKQEKVFHEDVVEPTAGNGSSDEFSDDYEEKMDSKITDQSISIGENLKRFKYELQEMLVSYSCRIFLGCFEEIYQQRYKRQLNYDSFGVNHLEELLEKVRDVVVVCEEPKSKRKYLVAFGG